MVHVLQKYSRAGSLNHKLSMYLLLLRNAHQSFREFAFSTDDFFLVTSITQIRSYNVKRQRMMSVDATKFEVEGQKMYCRNKSC